MILEELFWGNIYPAEKAIASKAELLETENEIMKIMTHFEETLPVKEYLMLEELSDHFAHRELMANKAQFIYGFRLGGQMVQEIFL